MVDYLIAGCITVGWLAFGHYGPFSPEWRAMSTPAARIGNFTWGVVGLIAGFVVLLYLQSQDFSPALDFFILAVIGGLAVIAFHLADKERDKRNAERRQREIK